jgi:CRP-like cAMP-binding protein
MILHAYAHLEPTQVFWLYWSELSQWEGLGDFIGRSILQQHQHYLAWLSLFGQKRAIDRLLGFLVLLTQEYGIPAPEGLYFPYPLTHAQIGRAIGATRVTVTRLIGRLRAKGVIILHQDHFICLPFLEQKAATTPNLELASH